MRLRIIHETVYEFSSSVFFEPHYLRFKPKNTPYIQLESFNLNIAPAPTGLSEHMDAENNLVYLCWFEDMHKKLSIQSELLLKSLLYNPFNFIIYPNEFLQLPISYDKNLKDILQPSLKLMSVYKPLIDYGKEVLFNSNGNTIDFLINLTRQIHADFILETREQGSPNSAAKTFRLKQGACRDLSWMQILLLRQMGLAARFVSGYYFLSLENADFELHAWVEAFLPGAGWIGFDPSHGIIAGNTHIPISSSAKSENTMAVTGTIRGNAGSELHTNLKIEVID